MYFGFHNWVWRLLDDNYEKQQHICELVQDPSETIL